jgi:hypothetical protein
VASGIPRFLYIHTLTYKNLSVPDELVRCPFPFSFRCSGHKYFIFWSHPVKNPSKTHRLPIAIWWWAAELFAFIFCSFCIRHTLGCFKFEKFQNSTARKNATMVKKTYRSLRRVSSLIRFAFLSNYTPNSHSFVDKRKKERRSCIYNLQTFTSIHCCFW